MVKIIHASAAKSIVDQHRKECPIRILDLPLSKLVPNLGKAIAAEPSRTAEYLLLLRTFVADNPELHRNFRSALERNTLSSYAESTAQDQNWLCLRSVLLLSTEIISQALQNPERDK